MQWFGNITIMGFGMSRITANRATYVALIKKETIQTMLQVSEDDNDDSTSSSEKEDSSPRRKGMPIDN